MVRSGEPPSGPGVETLRCDVTDEAAVGSVLSGLTHLHGVVNAAGLATLGPMEWTDTATLRSLFEVNVLGAHTVTRAAMPALRATSGSRLVNVSSMSGLIVPPFAGAYAASKFALEAMSDAWRMELAPLGVHVSVVEPGAMATPMWAKMLAALDALEGEAAYPEWPVAREALREAGQSAGAVDRAVADVLDALTSPQPRARYPDEDPQVLRRLRAMNEAERDALLRSGWGLGG
jgi:NAD(P)-dependent dehydrogenase (short-subunit alcohol dehydrogenase family)